jgi:hypothetical protein
MNMKNYIKWIVGTLCAVSLVVGPSAIADDSEVAENWVLSLGGVGVTVTEPSDTSFGVDLAVGLTGKFILPNEFGLRQSFSYANDDVTLNTRLYNDWTLFTVKKVNLDLFAGGAVGLQYGNQTPSWEIAPEAGFRWWLKDDVAVLTRVEIPFDLAVWEFKDVVRYFIGFQLKF